MDIRRLLTEVRREIARLQETDTDGRLIINLADRKGYKIASTKEELEHYKRQEMKRATKIIKKIKNMEWAEDAQIAMH